MTVAVGSGNATALANCTHEDPFGDGLHNPELDIAAIRAANLRMFAVRVFNWVFPAVLSTGPKGKHAQPRENKT